MIKSWIHLQVLCARAHFLTDCARRELTMGAVINRFKNFKAGAEDYDVDSDTYDRVDLDKVFEDISPFGWFQVGPWGVINLKMCCRW